MNKKIIIPAAILLIILGALWWVFFVNGTGGKEVEGFNTPTKQDGRAPLENEEDMRQAHKKITTAVLRQYESVKTLPLNAKQIELIKSEIEKQTGLETFVGTPAEFTKLRPDWYGKECGEKDLALVFTTSDDKKSFGAATFGPSRAFLFTKLDRKSVV